MENIKSIDTKSKFNFRAYLIPGLTIIFLVFGIVALINQFVNINFQEIVVKEISLPIFFIVVFGLILLHEFKNKIINVKIRSSYIEKRTYLGIDEIFRFEDLNGFATRTVKGKFESYEYLHLIKNNKPVIIISQTYHENYFELKNKIINKCKNLGSTNYGILDEIMEIFMVPSSSKCL